MAQDRKGVEEDNSFPRALNEGKQMGPQVPAAEGTKQGELARAVTGKLWSLSALLSIQEAEGRDSA